VDRHVRKSGKAVDITRPSSRALWTARMFHLARCDAPGFCRLEAVEKLPVKIF
jgi:hypothetical protein